jgi:hypothetical protein
VRADLRADEVEAFLRLPNGAIALVDGAYGQITLELAADVRGVAAESAARLRRALESDAPAPAKVSIGFWMKETSGGRVRNREIDAPASIPLRTTTPQRFEPPYRAS